MSETGLNPIYECSSPAVRNLAWFIGETARPLAIVVSATGTTVGFLAGLGMAELGVMATLVGGLYGGKVVERAIQSRADADVKKTQASTGASP